MNIPQDTLKLLQIQFHKVIDGRAKDLMELEENTYPNLQDYDGQEIYHPICGMYGGFSYYIKEEEKNEYILYCSSWSRVCGGSGQKHKVTIHSFELVEEGFV